MDPDTLLAPLVAIEAALGARVVWRFLRGMRATCITAAPGGPPAAERTAIVVPTLNESARLTPCMECLLAQGPEVAEILVVDGGSSDGTQALVRQFAARDARVRLLDASPVPDGWNGKAWGLDYGARRVAPDLPWILTVDADTRPAPGLARALLAYGMRSSDAAFSIAARQDIRSAGEGLLHPSLLTTLVYRFGPPGRATRRVSEAQANGQCFLFRRAPLETVGGFAAVRESICEDVTIARLLVASGYAVGFYEAGDLIRTRMYEGWRETWSNWTRSLPMRDRYFGAAGVVGLLEVTFAQALAPWTLLALLAIRRPPSPLRVALLAVTWALTALRLGTLVGAARAYVSRPWTYWLSPLCDIPVALALWRSATRRAHVWRGRALTRGGA
jgi:dolichol-phosphate mannosyltransferase